jgi:hypothetical protein
LFAIALDIRLDNHVISARRKIKNHLLDEQLQRLDSLLVDRAAQNR